MARWRPHRRLGAEEAQLMPGGKLVPRDKRKPPVSAMIIPRSFPCEEEINNHNKRKGGTFFEKIGK
ncbi:hypothetical protein [Neobacillus notoginsengisoli]|uniref:hypothetical protein n=1 Tax=Neobacillus notoginsengisoli TaxID=1578198 RepID=UPI0013144D9A|nr:hypothetical protein [Neobacillus notoginsengisoli]